jgi:hypothetical protein
MGSRRSHRLLALLTLAVLPGIGLGTGAGWSVALLTSSQAVGGNTFSTAAAFPTPPPTLTATNIACNNGGANSGQIEAGDTCVFTFSGAIATTSVLAAWSGASTNVVVRFTNSGTADSFAVWNAGNTSQLPLGTVTFNDDYVATNVTAGASGTASTMVYNSSAYTITITLGTISGTVNAVNANRKATWAPSATVTDPSGNPMSTTSVTGSNQKQF